MLQTTFWTHQHYADIWEQLRRPTPTIEVTVGGDYITIDTVGGKEGQPVQVPKEAREPETSEPAPKPKPTQGPAYLRRSLVLKQSQHPLRSTTMRRLSVSVH